MIVKKNGYKVKYPRENRTGNYPKYTDEDKQTFLGYLDQQIARIQLPNKDVDFLRTKLLEMYANPLKNYLNAQA